MTAIGTLTPDVWQGPINGPRKHVESFTRAGVAGAGLITGAAHPFQTQVVTQFHSDESSLTTIWGTAEAMIGTIVSVTDPHGDVFDSTAVMDVTGSLIGATGDADFVLTLTWSLLPDSTS